MAFDWGNKSLLRANMKSSKHTKRGFSLIEVCLAVLVIGLGLIPIFGLFPGGLRSMEEATADTRCALFTEVVMNGMRANAASMTNIADWTTGSFSNIAQGVVANSPLTTATPGVFKVQFPEIGSDWLRYRISVNEVTFSALVEVCDGEYGSFSPPHSSAYTEFYFQGM
jgi:hypothetical protein